MHLQAGIFFTHCIKICWKPPEPGTTVQIPSPNKALLIYYVVLVWCKVVVQPVYLSSGSVEGYSCITDGWPQKSSFQFLSRRENDCIPSAPSYVGSRNWRICPYSSWSASYPWGEETQPHLGIEPQGANSSCLLPCVVLSTIKSEGNIYSHIDIATGSQMVQKWFLEHK